MPLRDHFRPPVSKQASWEGFHGMWPASIVQQLRKRLPPGYVAEPRVHLGTLMEIDVGALESHETPAPRQPTAVAARPTPPGRRLPRCRPLRPIRPMNTSTKSAFSTWSGNERWSRPSNLSARPTRIDRSRVRPSSPSVPPYSARGSRVSIVDLVTVRRFNLYAQLMEFVGHPDRTMSNEEPPIYAASCRWVTKGTRARLEAWSHTLVVGQPLPTLPLWLREDLVMALDLEPSYEQACSDLWISEG